MPVERADEHPTFEIGGNTITSLAAPSRGSDEGALFRADLPAGSGLPPHRHDHFDVFTVVEGGGTVHLGDDAFELTPGDSVVSPWGAPLARGRVRRRLDRGDDAPAYQADPRGRRERDGPALGQLSLTPAS